MVLGTCINTIEPSCYTEYSPQKEVGDYLAKAVELFKGLDTFKVWEASVDGYVSGRC